MSNKQNDDHSPILDQLEITSGERRAVFVRDAAGWRPDWFYLGAEQRLRFEGHHFIFLANGIERASSMERVGDGARFGGRAACCGTEIDWAVTVTPDPAFDGFAIEAEFTPAETVELNKAMSFFETPTEWNNTEEALHAIGMNPVALWRGEESVTPKLWYNPQWAWAHPRSHRNLAPTETPFLCTRIVKGTGRRHYTFLGDWSACSHRIVGVSPLRGNSYGYLFVIGAMTWFVSIHKDPNFIFDASRTYRQRVRLSYADDLPGGTLDRWLFRPFAESLRQHLPADGRVEADRIARERGARLNAAHQWWLDAITGDREITGFFHPEKGLTCYISGPDPHRRHGYTFGFSYLWLMSHVAYLSHVTGEPQWIDGIARHLPPVREALAKMTLGRMGITEQMALSSLLHYLPLQPDSEIEQHVRRVVNDICATAVPADHGVQAQIGIVAARAAECFNDTACAEHATTLLRALAASLDGDFWHFGCEHVDNGPASGGQIHPQGMANTIHLALWAYRKTGDAVHLETAERMARMLAALCVATFNDSDDPEFDVRGWVNGSTSGRDLYAIFPPWESSEVIRALAAVLEYRNVPEFYDLIWYFARTYAAAFPAARRNKRGWTTDGRHTIWPGGVVSSERVNREHYPFMCYEDPWNLTMLATYQTIDVFPNYLAFGGCLAWADDGRLLVLCPRTVRFVRDENVRRMVHVWNPIGQPVSTKLHVRHLPVGMHRAEIDGRAAELADGSIGVIVPARSRAVVSVNVEWRRNGRAVGDEFRL